jgi:hypothetical protein
VHPEPSLRLQVGTDPTVWVLEGTDYDALAAELAGATGPVVLPVVAPFQGQLVLSPQRAGTFSLLGPPTVGGPHPVGDDPSGGGGPHPVGGPAALGEPSGGGPHPVGGPVGGSAALGEPSGGGPHPVGDAPTVGGPHPVGGAPTVYLPSVTAATRGSPVFTLASGDDLAAAEQKVVDAMTNSTRLTLQISTPSGSGLLVLNGATMAFAVLLPPAAQAGQP